MRSFFQDRRSACSAAVSSAGCLRSRRVPLGYRVHTFSPDYDTPTGQVADRELCRSYDDLEAVREFASSVDVMTFEFENVPAATAAAAAERALVRPAGSLLHVTQHRLREKSFLLAHGYPVAPFAAVDGEASLRAALVTIGAPAILKTAGWGYDGKGQASIAAPAGASAALQSIGGAEAILEARVPFEREISVIVARGGRWRDDRLRRDRKSPHRRRPGSLVGAGDDRPAIGRAGGRAGARDRGDGRAVWRALRRDLCGGRRAVGERARATAAQLGALTIDACVTSQFEQQVRAVCGLPLGSAARHRPAAMANLLGDLWRDGEPRWAAALADPRLRLHLYGKHEPRVGRKIGAPQRARDDGRGGSRGCARGARSAVS
jgi:5-(carboxyamino)imidazole ribonucleotide synthase